MKRILFFMAMLPMFFLQLVQMTMKYRKMERQEMETHLYLPLLELGKVEIILFHLEKINFIPHT